MVTAVVNPEPVGGAVIGSTTVPERVNSTTLYLSSEKGSIVKWQSSTDKFNTTTTDISNTSNEYTATNLTQATQFSAVVKNGTCDPVNSVAATITVASALPIQSSSVKAKRDGNVIMVLFDQIGKGISFFLNPVQNGKLEVQLNVLEAGIYLIQFFNTSGQMTYEEKLVHRGGYYSHSIQLPAKIGKGYFKIVIRGKDGTSNSLAMIIP